VDPQGARVSAPPTPVLEARGLVKAFGRVIGLDGVDLQLQPGEILGVIGDNGAGKSTLAVAPALDIATNLFLGRERRRAGALGSVLRMLDKKGMREAAARSLADLGIGTVQDLGQAVETLSGGQRQAVAVARAAAFGSKVVVLDEPTAALGVKESNQVLAMIVKLRERGLGVILISHNMPHVFEVADRIHIQRLGRCAGVVTPRSHTMAQAVAIMTGAATLETA
jgi:fructose transport system ATP-binding protein